MRWCLWWEWPNERVWTLVGVVFGGSGLIKGGLLYDINPVSSF